MAAYLQVAVRIDGTGTIVPGAVAAWRRENHGGRDYHVLAGTADPIMAAGLIEEAIAEDGFVWVLPISADGEVQHGLPNLRLFRGSDILSGWVRMDTRGVDGSPHIVKAADTPSDSTPHAMGSGDDAPTQHRPRPLLGGE